jgi:hypothetical protein
MFSYHASLTGIVRVARGAFRMVMKLSILRLQIVKEIGKNLGKLNGNQWFVN